MQRLVCGLTGLLWLPWVAAAQLHHALDVVLQPGTHSFQVMDTITLPEGSEGPLIFALHPFGVHSPRHLPHLLGGQSPPYPRRPPGTFCAR